jgi:hypothetical protein
MMAVVVMVRRGRSVKATRRRGRRVVTVGALTRLRERPDDGENGRDVGTAVALGHEIPVVVVVVVYQAAEGEKKKKKKKRKSVIDV